jgi:hypothetical protein
MDDPTELHAQSGVLSEPRRRHAQSGFLVEGPRLQGFLPTPPSKYELRSPIWQHGEALTEVSTGKPFYLCRICFNKPGEKIFLVELTNTLQALRHLEKHGYDKKGRKVEEVQKKRKAEQMNMREAVERQQQAQARAFDRTEWKHTFLEWAIVDDISLRKTTSKRLRSLCCYGNPVMDPVFPRNHSTTAEWVKKLFQATKPRIIESLAGAKSRITISFDAWKSDNSLNLLGVFAHYFDTHYRLKSVLLGLRPTYGNHTGEEQKKLLLAIFKEYQITSRIAYFMADNATNNDRAIELLQPELDNITAGKHRLRCAGHILNLVVKSMLYGTDKECLEDAIASQVDDETLEDSDVVVSFQRAIRDSNEESQMKAWRDKGPLGKLHNIVKHARYSESRRIIFKAKQREADHESERLFELIQNGGVRWQSDHDMIERALRLRDAIELYCSHFSSDTEHSLRSDTLTHEDWLELRDVLQLLSPIKRASKAVQADGCAFYGSLWQTLVTLEMQLGNLEHAKRQQEDRPNTHLKAMINLGWKKLRKYYVLSDQSPAYRAAIALHPHYKMRWFNKHWADVEDGAWVRSARAAIRQLYNEYKRRYSDSEAAATGALKTKDSARMMDEFEQAMCMDTSEELEDEYERYMRETPAPFDMPAIKWWQDNHHRYPVLRHMAFDLLAAPASSAAAERQFSIAGHVLNDERSSTQAELAQANQCLRNWFQQELVRTGDIEASTSSEQAA